MTCPQVFVIICVCPDTFPKDTHGADAHGMNDQWQHIPWFPRPLWASLHICLHLAERCPNLVMSWPFAHYVWVAPGFHHLTSVVLICVSEHRDTVIKPLQ